MEKTSYRNFLGFAAICSILGAITTALLIFLPNPEATDFMSKVQLHSNNLYLAKLWILFIHPQVNILASLGIAVLLLRKYPLLIITGLFFLLIWAYTEMSQQSLLIDALNQAWRPGYMEASDPNVKNAFYALITGTSGISDSKYFLLIYGFGLGSLLYGFALIKETCLGKWIGFALIFIGVLSLSSFARYYLGLSFFSPPADFAYTWIYPYLQPAVRIAIGVWIWKKIQESRGRCQET